MDVNDGEGAASRELEGGGPRRRNRKSKGPEGGTLGSLKEQEDSTGLEDP